MTPITSKFQVAFNKCIEKTGGKELDTIECFEQYCSEQVVDPVEQSDCFAQAKTIERCQTCSELKLESLQEKKGILDPEITSKICTECTKEFAGFKQLIDINNLLAKFQTSDGHILTRNDMDTDSDCVSINTCAKLVLTDKGITLLPSEIGNLTQLRELYLYINDLQSLPKEIGNLTQLQELRLSSNHLKDLPKEIGDLKQLRELYLLSNQLKSLPKEIGDLTQLQELELDGNKLKDLPEEIGKLSQLQTLGLAYNHLKSLPKEIGDLTKLQELGIKGNKLKNLPKEMNQLTSLKYLNTENNAELSPKQQISINNHKNVQEFLQGL